MHNRLRFNDGACCVVLFQCSVSFAINLFSDPLEYAKKTLVKPEFTYQSIELEFIKADRSFIQKKRFS